MLTKERIMEMRASASCTMVADEDLLDAFAMAEAFYDVFQANKHFGFFEGKGRAVEHIVKQYCAEVEQLKAELTAKPAIPSEPREKEVKALAKYLATDPAYAVTREPTEGSITAWKRSARKALCWFAEHYSAAPALPTETELAKVLEEIRKNWLNREPDGRERWDFFAAAILEFLVSKGGQAERPKCDTCGDTGIVDQRVGGFPGRQGLPGECPCPDCAAPIAKDETCVSIAAPAQRPFVPSAETVAAANMISSGLLGEQHKLDHLLIQAIATDLRDLAQAAGKGG